MTKFLITILLCLTLNNACAQDILKFKTIPITGTIEEFNVKMNEKNFVFLEDLYSKYHYIGMFYGRKVDVKVEYVPESKQVSCVTVIFPETGTDATKMYDHLIKQLDKKYKTRKESYVDGMQFWNYGTSYEITLSIGGQSKKVSLSYSDKKKADERYSYQNKHTEWMSEHQKDL